MSYGKKSSIGSINVQLQGLKQFQEALEQLGQRIQQAIPALLGVAVGENLGGLEYNSTFAAWSEAETTKVVVQAVIARKLPGNEGIVVVRIRPEIKGIALPFRKAYARQTTSTAGSQAVEQLKELQNTKEPWSFKGICDLLETVQTGLEFIDLEDALDDMEDAAPPRPPAKMVFGGTLRIKGLDSVVLQIPTVDLAKAQVTVTSVSGLVRGLFAGADSLVLVNATTAEQVVDWRVVA